MKAYILTRYLGFSFTSAIALTHTHTLTYTYTLFNTYTNIHTPTYTHSFGLRPTHSHTQRAGFKKRKVTCHFLVLA